jgi:hypothetical protein
MRNEKEGKSTIPVGSEKAQGTDPWFASAPLTESRPMAPEWALWQSVGPIRQAVRATATAADAINLGDSGTRSVPNVGLPHRLLRPLDALPRYVALEEVKARFGLPTAR